MSQRRSPCVATRLPLTERCCVSGCEEDVGIETLVLSSSGAKKTAKNKIPIRLLRRRTTEGSSIKVLSADLDVSKNRFVVSDEIRENASCERSNTPAQFYDWLFARTIADWSQATSRLLQCVLLRDVRVCARIKFCLREHKHVFLRTATSVVQLRLMYRGP